MNILFLSLLDFSDINESNIYADLLREFLKNNHFVYVISPSQKRTKRASITIKGENFEILKPSIGNITKVSIVEKGLSTIFLERSILKYLKTHKMKNIDLIIYTTPPITYLKLIQKYKRKDNAKSYLLLKDIFPQNAIDLEILSKKGIKGLLYKYFRKKEIKLYNISDLIGCMSTGNADYLTSKNKIAKHKVHVNPNSIDITKIKYFPIDRTTILTNYNIPKDKIVLIYGGNLGKPQDISFLIEYLRVIDKSEDIYNIVVGSGTEAYLLKKYIHDEKPKNFNYIEQLPVIEYEELVSACDVGLIFLNSKFTIPNYPSRILSYMKSKIPIVAATDETTDIKELILNNEMGLWCKSGDIDQLITNIGVLRNIEVRKKHGLNGYNFLINNFTAKHSYQIIMEELKNGSEIS